MKKYKTIFNNNEFLIVNKPAGFLTHGSDRIKEETLADQLMADYPELKKIGDDPYRPGIIHRLDRLVSGLLVIARTQASFDNLKTQFQKRTITKKYTALVYGRIDKDEDKINFLIKRSTKGYKMAAIPVTSKGKKTTNGRIAITYFIITKRYINYTLLKVKIKTGRTHQIRCHLAAYSHPLVGDDIYSTKKTRIKNKKLDCQRIFLVADELSFRDLAGRQHKFTVNLPANLKNFLKQIK